MRNSRVRIFALFFQMIIDDENKKMFFDFKSSATYDKWIILFMLYPANS
jgi:acyl-CoA-binding protein